EMAAILTAQELEKSFGTRRVLTGVSFAVGESDRIALVGVNGAGKSTLLQILAGDAPPDGGLVTRKRGLSVEYVAQEPRLDPGLTVGATLRQGLRAHARALEELEALGAEIADASGERLDAALARQADLHDRIADLGGWDQDHELRGLAAALSVPPGAAEIGALSLGERRRVAIARALPPRPEPPPPAQPTNHPAPATLTR